jgi:hypothetical protein
MGDIMLRAAISVLAISIAAAPALAGSMSKRNAQVAQETEISDVQREACTSDAWRLCSQHFPDAAAVKVCLRDNKPKLSPDCRTVFMRR